LFGDNVALLVLKVTMFVGIVALLGILGWIGYVMASTPPPLPLTEEPKPQTITTGENSDQKTPAT